MRSCLKPLNSRQRIGGKFRVNDLLQSPCNNHQAVWAELVECLGDAICAAVVGVGGDHVVCCDELGRITVNGVPLDEQSYLYPADAPSDQAFDVVVPDGMLWLMGDHRSNSADSRAHLGDPGGGMVPASRVVGRVMNVLWPLNRISSVPVPESFSAVNAGESQ